MKDLLLITCPSCGYLIYGRLWRCPGCGGADVGDKNKSVENKESHQDLQSSTMADFLAVKKAHH